MTSRILRAIVLGPAVVPVGAFIFAIASGSRVRESVAVATIYGVASYAGSLILGIPAHLALESRGLASLWHYVVAGAALGALVPAVLPMGVEQIGVLSPAAFLVFALSGASVAAVFWALALKGAPP